MSIKKNDINSNISTSIQKSSDSNSSGLVNNNTDTISSGVVKKNKIVEIADSPFSFSSSIWKFTEEDWKLYNN